MIYSTDLFYTFSKPVATQNRPKALASLVSMLVWRQVITTRYVSIVEKVKPGRGSQSVAGWGIMGQFK